MSKVRGALPILNCRMKALKFKDINDQYMYGFGLMARGSYLEFYCDSEIQIEEWRQAFKSSVVQLDAFAHFTPGEKIGEGNFAQVHECWRKDNLKIKFAMKSIKKAKVQNSPRQTVSQPIFDCGRNLCFKKSPFCGS